MRVPKPPPPLNFSEIGPERFAELFASGLSRVPENEYLHWDVLRHKPVPVKGFTSNDWWFATKIARLSSFNSLPFADKHGMPFRFNLPPFVWRMLHFVDRDASGKMEAPEAVTNPHTRDRFLVRSLMEEAITSSQLEGAATTRKDAKEMLRQGRKPRTRGEQMILNNYHAMEFIRENYTTPLSEQMILELHSILTKDSLGDPKGVGRWRRSDEDISIVDVRDATTLHVPPPADQLPERIKKLCDFANAGDVEPFLHPVLKAILIHFMIGYDHPFIDGNGRTARALFYWSMSNHFYWIIEFTSISAILRNAPAKYARSFLYTETDDNDVTYFIIYQLEVIIRAIQSLHEYIAAKTKEIKQADEWLTGPTALRSRLNHRQVALLQHALKHSYEAYSIRSHMASHNVTYETSRSDLLDLEGMQLLEKRQRGKAYAFTVPANLKDRLSALQRESTSTQLFDTP